MPNEKETKFSNKFQNKISKTLSDNGFFTHLPAG